MKHDYSRTISTEWEGFHWNDTSDPFDMVASQQDLLRREAENAGSRVITDASEARALTGFGRR